MISEAVLIFDHPKLALASAVAASVSVADAATDLRGWEDLTLKGVLVAVVLYLVREIARLRTESQERNTEREKELCKLVQDNTDAMRGMLAAVQRQTEYFDQIARKALDENLNHNHKNHD